jgi:GNAT superfamily N-acetyltransferase
MTVSVRGCTCAELIAHPDFDGLLSAYALESRLPGMPEPCADLASYSRLEAAGVLFAFQATVGDTLVGFAILLVSVLPHYTVTMGHVESYFVAADYRKQGAGLSLRRAMEHRARESNAHGIFIQAALGSRLGLVLEREEAYAEVSRVFLRVL